MREANISGVDLNLIPPLEALLRMRNVTHAAAEVGLSQPAMSRALARLRALLDDPLLVRGPGGYVLTPRAQAIEPALAEAVRNLRGVLGAQAFDPAKQRRTLRVAASDSQTVMLIPGVAARLAREAPGIDLQVHPIGPGTPAGIAQGALDLAFAIASTPLPPGSYSEVVGRDSLAVVMRRGHPAADRAWTLQDYGDHLHVGVTLLGDGHSELDATLAAAGVTRRLALTTPHFMAALAAVSQTDFVTTVAGTLAARFAPAFDLVLKPAPFAGSSFEVTLVCSHVRAKDPLLAWFREVVRDVARETDQRVGTGFSPR